MQLVNMPLCKKHGEWGNVSFAQTVSEDGDARYMLAHSKSTLNQ